ncbi:DUF4124 domain-containing protein [Shewanella xiamenensis]|uniref:DUF4124 domain-containing protein n=1 Tax=Shewanella xiamenensis TaxID=332186 RepID=UPI0035B955E7
MARLIVTLICVALPTTALANTVYKCRKDDKVVFSQTACPQEYSQHKIEYQLGISNEIDSDKRETKVDPLQALLNNHSLPPKKLLQLLDGEIYSLKQENSYFEILRASELQKLERQRYWQNKDKSDPDYLKQLSKINDHFDKLTTINSQLIQQLSDRKTQINADVEHEEPQKNDTH